MPSTLHSSPLAAIEDDLELYITPQNTCNLDCAFCCEDHLTSRPHRLSDTILYERLRPYYEKAALIWVVGGELTILPGMKDYVSYLGERYPRANLAIVTNGTKFDEEWRQLCLKHDVFVRCSLNASNAQAYANAVQLDRSEEVYTEIWDNLKAFLELKEQNGRPYPRPGVSMVVTKDSVADMPNFIGLACRHRLPAWMYMGMEGQWVSDFDELPPGDWRHAVHRQILELKEVFGAYVPIQVEHMANRLYLEARQAVRAELAAVANEIRARYATLLTQCASASSTTQLQTEEAAYRQSRGRHPWPKSHMKLNGVQVCRRPWAYIALSADGTVTPCCRRIQDWGNINRMDIGTIRNSPPARAMREAMLLGFYDHCWGACNCNLNPSSSYHYFYRKITQDRIPGWFDGHEETRHRLEPAFFAYKLSLWAEMGIRHLAIYGAGAHTRRLLQARDVLKHFTSILVVDDNPALTSKTIESYAIVNWEDKRLHAMDAVLISSDTHQAEMLAKACQRLHPSTRILCLYPAAAGNNLDDPSRFVSRP